MAKTINLQNYKNRRDVDESLFSDKEKREIEILKIKRFYKKDDGKVLNALLKKFSKSKSSYESTTYSKNYLSYRGQYVRSKPTNLNQQCIFKLRFGNNKAAHKRFIELYMPQLNKDEVLEKPKLFGDDIEDYEKNMVARHFKFIISPENQNVDLEILTKNFIAQMNTLYDMDLQYLAVQHNDTNHKHVHIVINGVDKNGKELKRINKNFIKYTAREMLSRMCTIQVGKRSYDEALDYAKLNAQRIRITPLDEQIKKLSFQNSNILYPYKINTLRQSLNRRLAFLEKLNLAKKVKGTYFLKEDWYETLQTSSRYNKFLEVKNEYAQSGKPVELFKNDTSIKGTVKKIYTMDDENTWQNGLILETENKIYYVPSYYKIHNKNLGKEVKISPDEKNKSAIKIQATKQFKSTNRSEV